MVLLSLTTDFTDYTDYRGMEKGVGRWKGEIENGI